MSKLRISMRESGKINSLEEFCRKNDMEYLGIMVDLNTGRAYNMPIVKIDNTYYYVYSQYINEENCTYLDFGYIEGVDIKKYISMNECSIIVITDKGQYGFLQNNLAKAQKLVLKLMRAGIQMEIQYYGKCTSDPANFLIESSQQQNS